MNKIIKKISLILIIVTILCVITNTVIYAQSAIPDVGAYEPTSEDTPANVTNIIGTIANIVQIIGIVISAVILVMIGIKYMVGSAEAKAEYKKTMIPYLVGAIFIAGTGTIVKIINEFTSKVIE